MGDKENADSVIILAEEDVVADRCDALEVPAG
jgi:hypothetical protein